MPPTKEQRNKFPMCSAKTRSGGRCRKWAGERTSHPGIGACYLHGGATPNHQQHAVKVEATRRAIEFGQLVDIEPGPALLLAVKLSAGQLVYLRSRLDDPDVDGFERQILASQWDGERDRLSRSARAAFESGIAERQIRLAESAGAELAQLVSGVLQDLGLSDDQRERLPAIMAEHFAQAERSEADLGQTVRVLDPPLSTRADRAKKRHGKRKLRRG
jgi:hypothetical protein